MVRDQRPVSLDFQADARIEAGSVIDQQSRDAVIGSDLLELCCSWVLAPRFGSPARPRRKGTWIMTPAVIGRRSAGAAGVVPGPRRSRC